MTLEQKNHQSVEFLIQKGRSTENKSPGLNIKFINFRNNVLLLWDDKTYFNIGDLGCEQLALSLKVIRRSLKLKSPIIIAIDMTN